MKTKRIAVLLVAAVLALSVRAADVNETLGNAVKALKEKSNYSWSATTVIADAPFPPMTTKGKTDKDGLTLLTSEGQNGEIQAVKKGDKGVIKAEEGWQTA